MYQLGRCRQDFWTFSKDLDGLYARSGKLDKATATIAQLTESIAASERATAEIAKQQAAMNTMRAEEKKVRMSHSRHASTVDTPAGAAAVVRIWQRAPGLFPVECLFRRFRWPKLAALASRDSPAEAFKKTKKDYEDGIEGLTMALQVKKKRKLCGWYLLPSFMCTSAVWMIVWNRRSADTAHTVA